MIEPKKVAAEPAISKPAISKPASPSAVAKDSLSSSVSASLANAPGPSEDAIAAADARRAKTEGKEAEKPKRHYSPRKPKPQGFVPPAESPDAKRDGYRRSGAQIADTFLVLARTMGGEDWAPRIVADAQGNVLVDEQKGMREAWADLSEEYEWGKMPAWAAVSIVMVSYTIPRLTMPSTLSRIEKAKLWWKMRKLSAEQRKRLESEEKKKRDEAAKEPPSRGA